MKMHRKKMDMSMRLRSGSLTFKSIPEEPSETAMDEVFKEMGSVLSGLAEFKTELLQLHAAVRGEGEGGGCVCVCVCMCVCVCVCVCVGECIQWNPSIVDTLGT